MSGSQGTLESVHSTASKVVTGKPPVVGDRSHVVGSRGGRVVGERRREVVRQLPRTLEHLALVVGAILELKRC